MAKKKREQRNKSKKKNKKIKKKLGNRVERDQSRKEGRAEHETLLTHKKQKNEKQKMNFFFELPQIIIFFVVFCNAKSNKI